MCTDNRLNFYGDGLKAELDLVPECFLPDRDLQPRPGCFRAAADERFGRGCKPRPAKKVSGGRALQGCLGLFMNNRRCYSDQTGFATVR